jgi:hypothetical protein
LAWGVPNCSAAASACVGIIGPSPAGFTHHRDAASVGAEVAHRAAVGTACA